MIEIAWADLPDLELRRRPAAMTIGVFDGLHRGHLSLLSCITADPSLLPLVVTFRRHPAQTLAPESFPGFIMSHAQKRRTLEAAGIAVVVLIDFSLEFSQLSGSEFLQRLVETFDLRFAGIGHDFRCGHEMSMDGKAIQSFLGARGVHVNLIDAFRDAGAIVSSTQIRQLIRAGKLDMAERLLGRAFSLDVSGEIVEGDGPDQWIALDERGLLPRSQQILPPAGRYEATVATDNGHKQVVLTIGENSVRLPLAPDTRIRYIVLQEKRVE